MQIGENHGNREQDIERGLNKECVTTGLYGEYITSF